MKVTRFGADNHSWNVGDRGDDYDYDGDGSHLPGVGLFSNALQVWASLQDRPVTVDEAALAFNISPDLIRQAISYHYYLLLEPGDVIGSDGE